MNYAAGMPAAWGMPQSMKEYDAEVKWQIFCRDFRIILMEETMGELVYANLEGLATASTDFLGAAGNIEQIKRTLDAELNSFADDMLGNALQPMRHCTTQMDLQLDAVNGRFAAISELLQDTMAKRAWMDNGLAINATIKARDNLSRRQTEVPMYIREKSLQWK